MFLKVIHTVLIIYNKYYTDNAINTTNSTARIIAPTYIATETAITTNFKHTYSVCLDVFTHSIEHDASK